MKRYSKGFTMIELVVAAAIILILVAVAFASYQDYSTRRARSQASTTLLELGKWLKQQHPTGGSYMTVRLPYTTLPIEGPARYNLSLAQTSVHATDPKADFPAVAQDAFTLMADPINADLCGTLLLDHTDRRGVTGVGVRVDDCWSK